MDGAARVATEVEIDAGGMLKARFRLDALRALETNRAGFTLLHPLRGVAGQDGEVVRPDGSCAAMTFPEAIAPAQPVRDIAGLRHAVRGVRVEIAMEGEVFEMEDQRNWSDASYKTYCRPLALPTPLRLGPGDVIEQTVRMSVSGQPHPAPSPDAANGETSGRDERRGHAPAGRPSSRGAGLAEPEPHRRERRVDAMDAGRAGTLEVVEGRPASASGGAGAGLSRPGGRHSPGCRRATHAGPRGGRARRGGPRASACDGVARGLPEELPARRTLAVRDGSRDGSARCGQGLSRRQGRGRHADQLHRAQPAPPGRRRLRHPRQRRYRSRRRRCLRRRDPGGDRRTSSPTACGSPARAAIASASSRSACARTPTDPRSPTTRPERASP